MFLWVAVKLKEDFSNNIRKKCKEFNRDINVSNDALILPSHISLKISFDILDNLKEDVIKEIKYIFKNVKPFIVKANKIEKNGSIIWVTFKHNDTLVSLHNSLDIMLMNKFNISQHEFDKCFMYHSTLFMDEDINKINEMFDLLKDIDVKDEILVESFIMGESKSGLAGTFKMIGEFKI